VIKLTKNIMITLPSELYEEAIKNIGGKYTSFQEYVRELIRKDIEKATTSKEAKA